MLTEGPFISKLITDEGRKEGGSTLGDIRKSGDTKITGIKHRCVSVRRAVVHIYPDEEFVSESFINVYIYVTGAQDFKVLLTVGAQGGVQHRVFGIGSIDPIRGPKATQAGGIPY